MARRCPLVTQGIRSVYFSKSKVTLQTRLQLIDYWSMDMPVSQQAKISEKRCIVVLQDVCSTKLLAIPIMLGGQGVAVQFSLCIPKRLT